MYDTHYKEIFARDQLNCSESPAEANPLPWASGNSVVIQWQSSVPAI